MTTDIRSSSSLSSHDIEEIKRLAGIGISVIDIAMSMDWSVQQRMTFCTEANIPGSEIALLMASARTSGRLQPIEKLHKAATEGNLDALRSLRRIEADSRYNELMNYMDDDELAD